MKKSEKGLGIGILMLLLLTVLMGCGIEKTNRTKIRDLEFSILSEEEIPEELKKQIEEKKAADFKLTFETPENLYIVHGYGEQTTGGYSIVVKEIYESSNAIFFDSELVGPRKGETITKSPSYPFVVVCTEKVDKTVVFD